MEAARSPPLFPSQRAGGAPAPYKRFAGGKILAEGEFTSPEHFNFPRNPKRRTRRFVVSFFLERATRLELASRHPANGSPPFAGALPHLGLNRAFGAGWRQRVRLLTKKQDTQLWVSFVKWSGQRGSNSLPPPWQGGALPDELCPRNKGYFNREIPACQDSSARFSSFSSETGVSWPSITNSIRPTGPSAG